MAPSSPPVPADRPRSACRWLVLCALLLGWLAIPLPGAPPRSVSAAVLLDETFRNATAPGFIFGGDACLTAAPLGSAAPGSIPGCPTGSPGLPDAVGSGALRLTRNTNNRSGFVIYNRPIPAGAGLAVTFDQFQYNGTGADGISFFLVDATQANQPTQPGAYGGSLGYAQRTSPSSVPGLTAGFIGLGLDTFGNYANPTEGRQGGEKFLPNSVALRGAGNGQTGYQFITKNQQALPAPIGVPGVTTRAAAQRRVKIQISPANVLQALVDFQDGKGFVAVIPPIDLNHNPGQPAFPTSFKFGFAASTGASTDYHEIQNLVVETNPPDLNIAKTHTGTFDPGTTGAYTLTVANSKAAGTTTGPVTVTDTLPDAVTPTGASGDGWDCGIAGQTVTCSRSDPLAFGASFPPITIAVNIGAQVVPEIVNTATVTTPDDSNPSDNSATDTIRFTADLAVTKASGQANVMPGDTITYTVVGRNNGPREVTGATIADTVPAAIASVSWTCTGAGGGVCGAPNGTGNAISTTADLPVNASVTYTISGTLSGAAAGSLVNTATVASPPNRPDPDLSNNTATNTITITPPPTPTPTPTPSATPTAIPTATATLTSTPVPTPTKGPPIAPEEVGTPSPAPTATSIPTPTSAPTPTATNTVPPATGTPIAPEEVKPTPTTAPPMPPTATSVPGTGTPAVPPTPTATPIIVQPPPPTPTRVIVGPPSPSVPASPPPATTTTGTPTPAAPASLTKRADVRSAAAGQTVTFTITLANPGAPLSNVTITDTVPDVFAVQRATGGGGATATTNGQTVTAQIPTVPAGGTATVTIVTVVREGEFGAFTNTATATGPGVNLAATAPVAVPSLPNTGYGYGARGHGRSATGMVGFAAVLVVVACVGVWRRRSSRP
jgi:uncharacterized repeat protein (TIGR01451 family)